jgi:hypothetical protein
MMSNKKTTTILDDVKINVKIKLSALWATVMFIYVYVDIFGFFEPGSLESILAGKVWTMDITQAWAMTGLLLMTIPSLMVFLSLAMNAKANRWTNIIVAALYILVAIGNPIGETWAYIYFGSAVEIVLLSLIIWHAWKWPKQEA